MSQNPSQSERVRALLEELQDALDEPGAIDPSLEEPLRETLQEVREALERARAEEAPEASLADRAQALALEFEAEHPMLAGLIHRLTVQLASLGI